MPRFGAIGKHGSIALVERLILALKVEGIRKLWVVPMRLDAMQEQLDRFLRWFDRHRPHQGLGGRDLGWRAACGPGWNLRSALDK